MKEFLKATNLASYVWHIPENRLELSEAWFSLFGMNGDEYHVENREWERRIHPEDRDGVLERLHGHFREETPYFQVAYRYWSDLKEWIWIEDCGQVVDRGEQGEPLRMMGFNRDVTAAMREKKQMKESNELLQLAADVANLGVYCIHLNEKIICVHSGVTGKNRLIDEKEMTLKQFLSHVRPSEKELVKRTFWQLQTREKQEVKLRFRLLDQNRHARWVEASCRWSTDELIIGVIRDVDEEARRLIELDRLANRDLLTGLFNRNVFERKLNGFSRTIEDQVIAVCDVDGLKILNDAFGHMMGDRMLRLFADALDEVFDEADLIARMGGDEFAVIDAKLSSSEMEKRFELLEQKIAKFDLPAQIGISYGIAEIEATEDPALAYKIAEDRMYRQKHLENFTKRNLMVQKLLTKMQAKNPLASRHAARMKSTMKRYVKDLPIESNEKEELILLAQFHDIGKLNVPNQVLEKSKGLNHRERIEVKRHPEIGYRIARSLPELAGIAHEVLTHHERWDGKGYPLHLKGEEIPYKVRVLSLLDYYDSITHDRPYRPAVEREVALKRIRQNSGRRFDPNLTKAFIDFMQKQ
jgi:diguanylate cyclase (GGDEF)-like protein